MMSSCFCLLALGLQSHVSFLTYYMDVRELNSGVCIYNVWQARYWLNHVPSPSFGLFQSFQVLLPYFIISISLLNLFQCSEDISINTTSTLLLSVKFTSKFCIWWIGQNNGFVSSWPVFSHNGRDKWHPKVTRFWEEPQKKWNAIKGQRR